MSDAPSPRSLERAREWLWTHQVGPQQDRTAPFFVESLALLIDSAVEEEREACLTIAQEAGMFGSELAAARIAKRIHDYIAARGAARAARREL